VSSLWIAFNQSHHQTQIKKPKASYKRSEANRVRKPRKKVGDMTSEEHQRETEKRRSEFGKGRAAKILNRAIESSFDIFDN
jgi:hypothetical protein